MKRIKVKHFLPDTSHCAVASCAVINNYYDKNTDYEYVKKIAYNKISKKIEDEGLDSPQICYLLNLLGFQKVSLITSDSSCLDFSWRNYGKRKMKQTLQTSIKMKKNKLEKNLTKSLYKWYALENYDNSIKIDYNFGKYIREYLNKRKPVIITFNWTMFFKAVKKKDSIIDPFNGEEEEHAVVANGYDDKGVWIVDSVYQGHEQIEKKYRKGFYKISWENLMSIIRQGDVIIPDNYKE